MKKVRLGDLGQIITGNTPSKNHSEFYESSDIPFIKPDDFESLNSISTSLNHKSYISEKARSKARIIPKQSVLVTCIGIIGKVMLTETEVSFNQQINAIIPNNLILAKYLSYQLIFNQNKLNFIANAPVVPIVNKTQFSDFEIQIHDDIEQQKAIIAVLENIDSQIIKRRQQLTKLNTLIKSRFYEMFLNDSFAFKKIGELTEDIKYGTSLPSTPNGQYGYLRMNNITEDGKLNIENLKYIDVPEKDFAKCVVKKGDVLFNRTNSVELVGKTCVYELDYAMVIAGYIIRVRTKKDILNPIFLSSFLNLNSTKKLLRNIAKGAVNQANINAKELQNIDIPLPPLALQNQFADFVAEVDKSQLAIKKSLEELETLKKSLMQAYFG